MTRRTDARGRSTNYGYDNADRLTSLTYFDGITPNVTYTYDQNGYLGLLTKAENTDDITQHPLISLMLCVSNNTSMISLRILVREGSIA